MIWTNLESPDLMYRYLSPSENYLSSLIALGISAIAALIVVVWI